LSQQIHQNILVFLAGLLHPDEPLQSVRLKANAFFAHRVDLLRTVSARAISKARPKFSQTAFARLNARLIELVTAQQDPRRRQGLRVIAADAAKSQGYSPAVGKRQMLFELLDGLRVDDSDFVVVRQFPCSARRRPS